MNDVREEWAVVAPAYRSTPVGAVALPSWRPELLAGSLTTLAMVLLGAPVGLIWAAIAPRAAVVVASDGVELVNPYTKAFIGADAYFVIVTLIVGAVCGVVAFVLGRRHSVGVVAGLAAGGVLAALAAARAGRQLYYHSAHTIADHARVGTHFHFYVALHAHAALVAWPIAAVVAFSLATLIAPGDDLG